MSAIWGTRHIDWDKDNLPVGHYHPSADIVNTADKGKIAIHADCSVRHEPGKPDEFLIGYNAYKADNVKDESSSSKFEESWADSERPSSLSLLYGDHTLNKSGELYFDHINTNQYSADLCSPQAQTDEDITSKMYSWHSGISSGRTGTLHRAADTSQNSVLSKYIARFRSGPALSRERRQQQCDTKPSDFWWLSDQSTTPAQSCTPEKTFQQTLSPSDVGSPRFQFGLSKMEAHLGADVENRDIQEKADQLLERTVSSLSSCEAAVSSEGLGSTFHSNGHTSNMENRWLEEHDRRPVKHSEPGIRSHLADEDILKQWRLRRRLELAREANNRSQFSIHTPLNRPLEQPSFLHKPYTTQNGFVTSEPRRHLFTIDASQQAKRNVTDVTEAPVKDVVKVDESCQTICDKRVRTKTSEVQTSVDAVGTSLHIVTPMKIDDSSGANDTVGVCETPTEYTSNGADSRHQDNRTMVAVTQESVGSDRTVKDGALDNETATKALNTVTRKPKIKRSSIGSKVRRSMAERDGVTLPQNHKVNTDGCHNSDDDGQRRKVELKGEKKQPIAPISHSSPRHTVSNAIGQVVGGWLSNRSNSWLSSSVESVGDQPTLHHIVRSCSKDSDSDETEFSEDSILVNLRSKRAAYFERLRQIDECLKSN